MKVMLVDDNSIDLFLNKRILELAGIGQSFSTFDSSIDAINHLTNSNNSSVELPELLFIDIQMPDLNGFEVLERLYSFFEKKIPFKTFLLSSTIHTSDLMKAEQFSPFITLLEKPLSPEKLKTLI